MLEVDASGGLFERYENRLSEFAGNGKRRARMNLFRPASLELSDPFSKRLHGETCGAPTFLRSIELWFLGSVLDRAGSVRHASRRTKLRQTAPQVEKRRP
jgi:hypothetical protein